MVGRKQSIGAGGRLGGSARAPDPADAVGLSRAVAAFGLAAVIVEYQVLLPWGFEADRLRARGVPTCAARCCSVATACSCPAAGGAARLGISMCNIAILIVVIGATE